MKEETAKRLGFLKILSVSLYDGDDSFQLHRPVRIGGPHVWQVVQLRTQCSAEILLSSSMLLIWLALV